MEQSFQSQLNEIFLLSDYRNERNITRTKKEAKTS